MVPAKSSTVILGGPVERVGITSEATIHIKLPACDTMQALSSSALAHRTETKSHADDPNFGCGRQAALGSLLY